jgi:hypothetical protein
MTRFLSCGELYDTIQQKSLGTKEILWVCSPFLGLDAHEIFSQMMLKNPPTDIRFVLRVTNETVKRGEVNPLEIQYFMEHFPNASIRSHDTFNSIIYVFDDSVLVTSANLTKSAFESNIEVGVLLDDSQLDGVKNFFKSSLWENAKPIGDIKKFKKLWRAGKENEVLAYSNKNKAHTKIKEWTNEGVSTWYFAISDLMSKKIERKIQKETNWASELKLVRDIGPGYFKHLKLGDLAFMADLSKRRGNVKVELGRVFDKSRVETDEGDFHFAYETQKVYSIDRNRFYEILKNATISPKHWAILLNEDQAKLITDALSSKKQKKKR